MNDFLHAFIQFHPLTSGVKCLHIRCVLNCDIRQGKANKTKHVRDGFKKKRNLMEFSIKGPDPASQHLNGKKNKIKHGLKMLYIT